MATKQFDPLALGATPVEDTFDPLALGAQPVQEPQKDFLTKASDFGNALFPGTKAIGESLGTAALNIERLARGQDPNIPVDIPKTIGGYLQAGSTVAGATSPLVPSIAGKAAQFGALGTLSGAGKGLEEGTDSTKSALMGAATGAATGVAFGAAEKGLKALAPFIQRRGEAIQTSVIKPTAADVKDGFDIKNINKYGLGGGIKKTFEKTESLLDDLSNQLNTKITAEGAPPVDINDVFNKTVARVGGSKLSTFGSNTSISSALKQLQNEVIDIAGDTGEIALQDAQVVKRAAGHFGAWQHGMFDPESTARQSVYNVFYNELKKTIEKTAPEGVKEINKQISELIPIMNALIRRIPVAERNSALSLSDIITLTASSLDPKVLGLSLVNRLSKSGAVGAVLAKLGQVATPAGEIASKGVQKLEQPAKMFLPGFTNQLPL